MKKSFRDTVYIADWFTKSQSVFSYPFLYIASPIKKVWLLNLHSLRTVLTVSDQISLFTQTDLLCN